MKKFLEALPGLVFAALYFGNWAIFGNWDIYLATAGLMVSALIQVLVMKLYGWKISAMIGLFFWLAMIFGGMTLVFQNVVFIQWKPTIFHWGAALAIVSSRFIGDGHFIRDALGRFLSLDLPDSAWKHLTWGWAIGWFTMGAAMRKVNFQYKCGWRTSRSPVLFLHLLWSSRVISTFTVAICSHTTRGLSQIAVKIIRTTKQLKEAPRANDPTLSARCNRISNSYDRALS